MSFAVALVLLSLQLSHLAHCAISPFGSYQVNVTIFMESHCPDTARFLAYEFQPIWNEASRLMTVDIIPFGKAKWISQNGKVEFTCQHGESECEMNRYMLCGIDAVNNRPELYVDFVLCSTMKKVDQVEICARHARLSHDQLLRCAKGEKGSKLFMEAGKRTGKLSFVPTVLVDSMRLPDEGVTKSGYFGSVFCELLVKHGVSLQQCVQGTSSSTSITTAKPNPGYATPAYTTPGPYAGNYAIAHPFYDNRVQVAGQQNVRLPAGNRGAGFPGGNYGNNGPGNPSVNYENKGQGNPGTYGNQGAMNPGTSYGNQGPGTSSGGKSGYNSDRFVQHPKGGLMILPKAAIVSSGPNGDQNLRLPQYQAWSPDEAATGGPPPPSTHLPAVGPNQSHQGPTNYPMSNSQMFPSSNVALAGFGNQAPHPGPPQGPPPQPQNPYGPDWVQAQYGRHSNYNAFGFEGQNQQLFNDPGQPPFQFKPGFGQRPPQNPNFNNNQQPPYPGRNRGPPPMPQQQPMNNGYPGNHNYPQQQGLPRFPNPNVRRQNNFQFQGSNNQPNFPPQNRFQGPPQNKFQGPPPPAHNTYGPQPNWGPNHHEFNNFPGPNGPQPRFNGQAPPMNPPRPPMPPRRGGSMPFRFSPQQPTNRFGGNRWMPHGPRFKDSQESEDGTKTDDGIEVEYSTLNSTELSQSTAPDLGSSLQDISSNGTTVLIGDTSET